MKFKIFELWGLSFGIVTDVWLFFKNVGAEKERCLVSFAVRVRFNLVMNMPKSRGREKQRKLMSAQ